MCGNKESLEQIQEKGNKSSECVQQSVPTVWNTQMNLLEPQRLLLSQVLWTNDND